MINIYKFQQLCKFYNYYCKKDVSCNILDYDNVNIGCYSLKLMKDIFKELLYEIASED